MRIWLGIALLAASWLFGLSYYQAANLPVWVALVVPGVALLWNTSHRALSRIEGAVATVVLVAGLVLGLLPFDLPLGDYVSFLPVALIAFGLGVRVCAPTHRLVASAGDTLLTAGLVLLAQRIVLFGYEVITARSHELPTALAFVVGGVARLLSLDAAQFESSVTLHSMRELHRIGATWELLLDPVSLCFWAGGLAWLATAATRSAPAGTSRAARAWEAWKPACVLSAVMAVWLPVRVGLLIVLYMHFGLRLEFEEQPDAMILFWQPWVHGTLLVVPALLAWRWVPRRDAAAADAIAVAQLVPVRGHRVAAMGFAALAAVSAGFGLWWDPVGERKAGRVLVDEFHVGHSPRSGKMIHWEPTTRPYDTEWYGQDAAYNYACIYQYLTHHYNVRRLEPKNQLEGRATKEPAADSLLIDRIDSAALADCDVLVLKVPTADFAPREVEAIKRFVEDGGGLLLIGEHTDVFGTGRHLNSVAREFGFAFRHDCLFGIDHVTSEKARQTELRSLTEKAHYAKRPEHSEPPLVFDQRYHQPWVPHPVVQDMPPLDFATSASIEPGKSMGRAVIRSTGLWSLPADYHADNYYPQVVWRSDMRYGAFTQLWSTRYGKGRVLAFPDSTIFSNFSAFQPGKAELVLGMVEWLNHRNTLVDPRLWLFALAAGALGLAVFFARGWSGARAVLIAVAAGAFLMTAPMVRAIHRAGMPAPVADESKITRVLFDRTVSDAWLPNGSFIDGKPYGFAIFERWILRLGYFIGRGEEEEALRGDLLVIVNPGKPVTPRFREQLTEYVEQGGKLLVVDSTAYEGSTANDLLEPFDMAFEDEDGIDGTMTNDLDWPSVPVERVRQVRGGTPFLYVSGKVAGSVASYGEGKVYVLGCGDRFSDAKMGVTGDTIPDAEMRKVYDVEYALFRWILEGK